MKTRYLFLLFVLLLGLTRAQAQISYTFSAVSSSFTANASPTTLHAAGVDDALSAAMNIGFTFTYNCTTYTQFMASSNGWLSLGATASSNLLSNALGTTGQGPIIAPLWDDLAVGTGGTVNYKLTGSSPNRVLTVEWLNMKWQYGAANPVISFQVKLYETTNVIEFVYRQDATAVSSGSASIGINGGSSATDFYSLNGTGTSPTANYGTETNTLSTKPATGQIYRWTPGAAMAYSSCTTSQPNTSSVVRCDQDQDIIAIQIVTTGSCSPISVTQFQVNMTGSTIPGTNTNDVTKIHIYYTGTSSTFSATSEFLTGGTVPASGTITINGSQALASGTNYFWIAYDMNGSTATIANVVDAQCTQLTAGGVARTPATTSPAGTRTIAACATAPGAVGTGIAFWVKANAGTSTTTNGNSLATWSDQSGNTRNGTSGVGNQPVFRDNATNNVNFNPTLEFNGSSQYLDVANGAIAANNNHYDLYIVAVPGTQHNTTPGKIFGSGVYGGTDDVLAVDIRGTNAINHGWDNDDNIISNQVTTAYPFVGSFLYSNSTFKRTSYMQGTLISTATPIGVRTNNNTMVGIGRARNPNNEFYQGTIAEIVSYDNVIHSATQRQKVETYLGIKYGATLANNYISSTGTTVWDHSLNASYNNNIIGIARDDNSVLSQKQSKSTSTTADILTIYIGPTKQTNQASNTGTFTAGDNSFFIVGSDGQAAINTTWPHPEIPGGICCRLKREWLVQKTNFTNTDLKLEFDFNTLTNYGSLNVADLRLLVDADGNFTNATILGTPSITIAVSSNVVTVTVAASNFTTTPYFTLASVSTTTPLPIELTRFDNECVNGKMKLHWTTASEMNNEGFYLERSADGINFTRLCRIDGAGTSSQVHQYEWTDETPLPGQAYYRLFQKDYNRAPEQVGMLTADGCMSEGLNISIYPNPFTGTTSWYAGLAEDAQLSLEVFDIQGRLVRQPADHLALEKGTHRMEIDLSDLAPGVYFVRTTLGGKTFQDRIIKY